MINWDSLHQNNRYDQGYEAGRRSVETERSAQAFADLVIGFIGFVIRAAWKLLTVVVPIIVGLILRFPEFIKFIVKNGIVEKPINYVIHIIIGIIYAIYVIISDTCRAYIVAKPFVSKYIIIGVIGATVGTVATIYATMAMDMVCGYDDEPSKIIGAVVAMVCKGDVTIGAAVGATLSIVVGIFIAVKPFISKYIMISVIGAAVGAITTIGAKVTGYIVCGHDGPDTIIGAMACKGDVTIGAIIGAAISVVGAIVAKPCVLEFIKNINDKTVINDGTNTSKFIKDISNITSYAIVGAIISGITAITAIAITSEGAIGHIVCEYKPDTIIGAVAAIACKGDVTTNVTIGFAIIGSIFAIPTAPCAKSLAKAIFFPIEYFSTPPDLTILDLNN